MILFDIAPIGILAVGLGFIIFCLLILAAIVLIVFKLLRRK